MSKKSKKCFECSKPATVDHHPVPQSRGGTKTIPLCGKCHGKAHHSDKNMTTSKLTKEALQRKKALNERVGQIPYGWKLVGKTNLVKHPKEQLTITDMKIMRRDGKSYRAICDVLNKENIPTQKGGLWHYQTVRSILLNAGT